MNKIKSVQALNQRELDAVTYALPSTLSQSTTH